MALDLNVEPPAWLMRASAEGTDPIRNIREAQAGAALSETLLQAQSMQQQLLTQAQQSRDKALDMQELPQWLRDHPTYDSRQNTPWPTPRTPWGQQIIENWRNQDVTSDIRAQKMEQARENIRIQQENARAQNAIKIKQTEMWNEAIAAIDDAELLSRVMPKTPGGIPDAQQQALINQWRISRKPAMLPVGQKQNEMQKVETTPARVRTVKTATEWDQEADRIEKDDPEGAAELRKAAEALRGAHGKSAGTEADLKSLQTRKAKIEESMDKTQRALSAATVAGNKAEIAKLRADLVESINIRNQIDKEIEAKSAKSSKSSASENPDDPASLGLYR